MKRRVKKKSKYFIPVPPNVWECANYVRVGPDGNFYHFDGAEHVDEHYVARGILNSNLKKIELEK